MADSWWRRRSRASPPTGLTFGDSIDITGQTIATGLGNTFSSSTGTLTVQTPSGVNAYAQSDGTGGTEITAVSAAIGVYRFFNAGNGTHLYTVDANEAQTIQQTRPDLVYEGNTSLAALTPNNGDPNAAPIYRFFDATDGSYFYTASASERDAVAATRPDLVYEAGSTFYEHTRAVTPTLSPSCAGDQLASAPRRHSRFGSLARTESVAP